MILQLAYIGLFKKDQRVHERGVVRGNAKLLIGPHGESESYDLGNDPMERQVDPPSLHPSAERLLAALNRAEARLESRAALSPGEEEEIDEQTVERLRALGYGS